MTTNLGSSNVTVWPSLSQAARLLGVSPSTLSRYPGLATQPFGRLEHRVSPAIVIRLAREYRRRVVEDVSYDLVALAELRDRRQARVVAREVDRELLKPSSHTRQLDIDAFLATAKSSLPPQLYRAVHQALHPTSGAVRADEQRRLPSRQGREGRRVTRVGTERAQMAVTRGVLTPA